MTAKAFRLSTWKCQSATACPICRPAVAVSSFYRQRQYTHHHVVVYDGVKTREVLCSCSAYADPASYRYKGTPIHRDEARRLAVTHATGCRCAKCIRFRVHSQHGSRPEDIVARKLLNKHLTPWQRRTFSRRGYIDVVAFDGSIWRLDGLRHSGNAWEGRVISGVGARAARQRDGSGTVNTWLGYCIVDDTGVPWCDMYLAQILMLKTRPGEFRRAGVSTGTTVIDDRLGVGYRMFRYPFRVE